MSYEALIKKAWSSGTYTLGEAEEVLHLAAVVKRFGDPGRQGILEPVDTQVARQVHPLRPEHQRHRCAGPRANGGAGANGRDPR